MAIKPQKQHLHHKKGSGSRPPRLKKQPESQLISISGRRPVQELLRQNVIPEILLVAKREHSRKEEPLLNQCRQAGWKIEERERTELDQLAEGLPHQSYIALIREFPYVHFSEFLARIEGLDQPLVLALDQIQDVGNLGAILRTAECAGAEGVVLPVHRSAGITAAAIRRSAGAALHLPICRVVNLSSALDQLTDLGFFVVGADQEGSQSLFEANLSGPIVLVVGSEGRGLRPGIKRRCDALLSIPMRGRIASLNASAAAAICIFEVIRQRSAVTQTNTK